MWCRSAQPWLAHSRSAPTKSERTAFVRVCAPRAIVGAAVCSLYSDRLKSERLAAITAILLAPPFVLIDHGHFQCSPPATSALRSLLAPPTLVFASAAAASGNAHITTRRVLRIQHGTCPPPPPCFPLGAVVQVQLH